MARGPSIQFADFRLEPHDARLWRGTQSIKLKPKAFSVLHCLVGRAGQLVTKDELWQTVWPDVTVSDDVLSASIREIRKALGDSPKTPRFIETVHRRGYRFIEEVVSREEEARDWGLGTGFSSPQAPSLKPQVPNFVGRDSELTHLHNLLEKARDGERQIVFLTGEPGIGKTALIEGFLSSVLPPASEPTPDPQSLTLVLQGQCIEQFGEGEAYLPILTAIGQFGRTAAGQQLIKVLQHYAPSWLVQLPALVSPAELEVVRHRTAGATRPRMLREIAEALEALSTEHPLILTLEDLHWSDPSTLELLSFIAKRRTPARLLILGSYRPIEMLATDHPLRAVLRELRLHKQCQELSLPLLKEPDVSSYLTQRIHEHPSSNGVAVAPEAETTAHEPKSFRKIAALIYQRTEGNPLFMISLVNELETRGVFTAQHNNDTWSQQATVLTQDVPDNIRQFVTDQCDRLMPAEQRLLEAASLAGMTFSTAAVAAALENDLVETEEGCARLAAQQRFLRPAGIVKWPDGTVAAGYGFLHALYQQLWHERVTVSKLQQFHLRIGTRKEIAYGDQASEIAAELAMHFDQGRDYHRAVQYLGQAGRNAIQRNASHEATALLSKGLELLRTLPETSERNRQELSLQTTLGIPLTVTKGWAAPEVGLVYARARELCEQVDETSQALSTIWVGLSAFYLNRAELQTAYELAEQYLHLAQKIQDSNLIATAYGALAEALYFMGEFVSAQTYLEKELALYASPQYDRSDSWQESKVICLCWQSCVLYFLGYVDQALQRGYEALALAREMGTPFDIATALGYVAGIHRRRREPQRAQEVGESVIALAREHGFTQVIADETFYQGWGLVEQGQAEQGVAQMQQSLVATLATGAELGKLSRLALLAEAHGKWGKLSEGLGILDEALVIVEETCRRDLEAELYRLKGALILRSGVQGPPFDYTSAQPFSPHAQVEGEAEAYFLKALDVARRQSAKSWELRATMSLARLWRQQGKNAEAHHMLSEIYNWFNEGFDTLDLREAKTLLDELSSPSDLTNDLTHRSRSK